MGNQAIGPLHNHDLHVDGCACDIELEVGEIVADSELPPASGGVQVEVSARALPDDTDGCDVEFDSELETDDAALPAATGGVI